MVAQIAAAMSLHSTGHIPLISFSDVSCIQDSAVLHVHEPLACWAAMMQFRSLPYETEGLHIRMGERERDRDRDLERRDRDRDLERRDRDRDLERSL